MTLLISRIENILVYNCHSDKSLIIVNNFTIYYYCGHRQALAEPSVKNQKNMCIGILA